MKNLFVVSSSGDPLSDMMLTGETIEQAAKNPRAIGQLLIDMAYSEGKEMEGNALYIERNSNKKRILERFETGAEDYITGGWVRVITTPEQLAKEQKPLQRMIKEGDAFDHGIYRGVRLIEFNIKKADLDAARKAKGFG